MVEETTRTQHVWRQRNEDDEEVWLDLLRVDKLVTTKGQQEDWQEVTYNIKWDDEANPADHPTRTLRVVEVANPDDEGQIIEVHAIAKMQTMKSDQKITYRFLGGEVASQQVKYRRVYHMDADDPEPPCSLEDYVRDEETLDEEQYVDVRVIDRMTTVGQDGQVEFYNFDNRRLYEFSVPTPEDELDLDKVVFLDPFQNIVNVQWGSTMWVVAIRSAASDIRLYHSSDGQTWSERDLTIGGYAVDAAISYGHGKWLAGASKFESPLYQSDDGISWTTTPNPLSTLGWVFSACSGNGVHVLGGWGEYAWSDDNGETWHAQTLPHDGDIVSSLNFIKADPDNPATVDRFFMGLTSAAPEGAAPDDIGNRLQLMTSTDGMTWSSPQTLFLDVPVGGAVAEPHFLGRVLGLKGVAYGNGKYVVSGGVEIDGALAGTDDARIYTETSTDGTSWSASHDTGVAHSGGAVFGFANSGQNIAFGNGTFVIAGAAYESPTIGQARMGMISASTDGVSWSQVFSGDVYHILSEVDFGGGRFVAGGVRGSDDDQSAVLMWSEDGHAWNYSEIEHEHLSQVAAIRKGSK